MSLCGPKVEMSLGAADATLPTSRAPVVRTRLEGMAYPKHLGLGTAGLVTVADGLIQEPAGGQAGVCLLYYLLFISDCLTVNRNA